MELALYRACRPRRFDEFVGQEHVTRTLKNALAQGRLAHAYLFCGPRGTGKTSAARVLAKALSCPAAQDGEPCGECPSCIRIGLGEGLDVVEMDAASNRGIDEIRSLRERIRLSPVAGRYKVYVIDEVHMLTNEAFNALLKTLEEPPANVLFVLCTTEAYRVPATILSRCQRFDFQRLGVEPIAAHLERIVRERGLPAEPAALRMIARVATGSVRDALGILDQCMAYAPSGVTVEDTRRVLGAVDARALVELADAVLQGDVGASWQVLDNLLAQGRDPREVTRALVGHFRDLLLYSLAGRAGELTGPAADDTAIVERQAGSSTREWLCQAIEAMAAVEAEMRLSLQPRLLLESRLVRLCGRQPQAVQPALQAPPPAARSTTAVEAPVMASEAREAGSGGKEPMDLGGAVVASRSPSAPDATGDLPAPALIWAQVLRELSDKDAGLLHGSEAAWEQNVLVVSLPCGYEAPARSLKSSGCEAAISAIANRLVGLPVSARIEVRQADAGLFGLEPREPRRGRAPASDADRGASSAKRSRERRTKSTDEAPLNTDDNSGGNGNNNSITRQAEAMFRAEEIKGGPTEK